MVEHLIEETDCFTIEQARDYRVPGYLIVRHKQGARELAELSAAAGAELMRCLIGAEALVRELVAPERIYVLKFAELDPRLHFHVFPRSARLGAAYSAQTGESAPFNGAQVVEWTWKQHASLGFTDEELERFLERARAWVRAR